MTHGEEEEEEEEARHLLQLRRECTGPEEARARPPLQEREILRGESWLATLSYNARSLRELLSLLDNKLLASRALLASTFFRAHNEALCEESKREFDARGQRIAVAYDHAKVVALDFGGSKKIVLEGSANLRSNRNVEQIAILADTGLHDWHAAWIEDHVTRHRSTDDAPATETA